MNFLEKSCHVSIQKIDVFLVGQPKMNPVKLLLKVTNLHDGLGLADV